MASIAEKAPRVLTVSGPPGYRKNALLRAFALHAGTLVTCDLHQAGEAGDLSRPILDALVADDRPLAARSAAGRLAQPRELVPATTREVLRRVWPLEAEHSVFGLRDIGGVLATPAGVDLAGELIASLPVSRTLAIVSRAPLPPALAQLVERERFAAIAAADLALSREETEAIAIDAGLDRQAAGALFEVARGWPLVTQLLARLAGMDGPGNLGEAADLPFHALLAFAVHRTIARLGGDLREALVVCAVLRGASQTDLIRVLGDVADDWLFTQLTSLPFIELQLEHATVHPEVVRLLRERFQSLTSALYERTLHVLSGDGAYVKAASLAIDHGDVKRAAAIIDAAPPYTASRVPLGEYERVLDRLDRDLVTQYPNVWLATIPYRAFSVDRATYVREAETVYYCLPRTANPDQRAVVLIHLGSAYTNAGRHAESEDLLETALRGFAREPTSARATLLTFAATLRGMEGRFSTARALADEAVRIDPPDFVFGENQTLHYIDAHEAAFRGQHERALLMFDELVRRLSREELPLYLSYAATNGALVAWVAGDDLRFERYLGVLEDRLTPGIERGFAPMIDAARGRAPQFDANYAWPVVAAIAHLYRIGEATEQRDALEAARAAARAADERRDPYVQIFAHTAIYVLDVAAREAEESMLRTLIAPIESPELSDAVDRLLQGKPAGILETFIQRRLLRDRARNDPRLVVELIGGRVTKDGQVVKLTDKEFELMALLASSRLVLSRDRVGEALWSHIDPEEWPNNIKVTLSRLRSKLGVRDAVMSTDGAGYRLAPAIDVDLRRAEALVRRRSNEPLDDAARDALRAIVTSYRTGAPGRYERFGWMQAPVARINDVVCSAALTLAHDALSAERFDDALIYAGAVADVDSLNESACEVVIRARISRGELDAARREFQRYAVALADELDATPSAQLAALARVPA